MRTHPVSLRFLAVAAGAALSAHFASATTLTFKGTADNAFDAFISTSATDTGTQIASGTSWPTLVTGMATLTSGTTNYLHVRAVDQGPPAMFLALAGLDDTEFAFDNGGQTALTGDAGWSVSKIGFGQATEAVVDLGPNGTSPWGNFAGLPSETHFVWADTDHTSDPLYFSLTINTVPEPMTVSIFGLGLVALLRRPRRKI